MDSYLGAGNIIQGVGQLGHGYGLAKSPTMTPNMGGYQGTTVPQAPPGMYLSTYGTTTPYNYPQQQTKP